MVEHPRLWIGPWQAAQPNPATERQRAIRDPVADRTLGAVQRSGRGRHPWWRFWNRPPGMEVCETEDLALLMSVCPSRLTAGVLVVRDCDESEIGKLRGDELLDPWSQPFARRTLISDNTWQMGELDGRVYGECTLQDDGDLITFRDIELTNPFVRMLVVASFLQIRGNP